MAADVTAWMDAARGGDREAFGHLYIHYRPTVMRYIHHRVHNPQTVEDLTADVFLRALRSIDTFTWQGRDPGAWLITIARNAVADWHKAGARRELLTDDYQAAELGGQLVDRADPADQAAANRDARELRMAIRRLGSPRQREVLMRRFLDGLSEKEAAAAMGYQVDAAKALCYRARQNLSRDPRLRATVVA